MKIVYFGSPAISAELMQAILEAGVHEVVGVVSNADRPRGRSGKLQATEVSQVAIDRGLPLFRFESLKGEGPPAELACLGAELFVVFAYGKIMPASIYDLPPEGSINLHASLLPELRGASPIQSAILNGFERTGWTVQRIAQKMDAGDIIAMNEVAIDPNEDTAELTEKLLPEGIRLVQETLADWPAARQNARVQDHAAATYCRKIEAGDARLDWSKSAADLHNQIRAFAPKPLAWTMGPAGRMKIHRAQLLATSSLEELGISAEEHEKLAGKPGSIAVGRVGKKLKFLVVTGAGFLEILILQPENRKKMSAADFLNGSRVQSGDRLISPES